MLWELMVRNLLEREEEKDKPAAEMIEQYGYVSYLPKDDLLFQVLSQRDNKTWMTATYFQQLNPNATVDGPDEDVIVVQLEGLPEDPNNYKISLADIEIRVYKRDTFME